MPSRRKLFERAVPIASRYRDERGEARKIERTRERRREEERERTELCFCFPDSRNGAFGGAREESGEKKKS